MNPQYVILGAPFWKMWSKKIILWYASGGVPAMLKIADKFTDVAVASTSEGYRISGDKLVTIGQGVDINKFKPDPDHKPQTKKYKIASVGRITPSKDYETLIAAAEIFKKNNRDFEIESVGQPAVKNDVWYLENLKRTIENKNLSPFFRFIGPTISISKSLLFFLNIS